MTLPQSSYRPCVSAIVGRVGSGICTSLPPCVCGSFLEPSGGITREPAPTFPVQERVRRIGVLMGWSESDGEAQSDLAAFVHDLQQLGWTAGRNIQIDYRWANGDVDRMRSFAKELVGMQADVIVNFQDFFRGYL